ncbi:MAG TPA: acyloxyacyl hydrolase [Stellaceae bacterium]|nr:acyloxyacyl hydrolase [Stellaceae bacterium]
MASSTRRAAIAAVMLGFFVSFALAPRASGAEDPNYIAVGAGVYDVLHDFKAAQGRLEFRFADRFLFIKPMVGVLFTSKGSVMGYGGIRIDLYLGPHIVITPNAAVGGFYRGNGKNLGSTIEFKTGGEFAWRFDDHSRLGLAFDHISNAGIGKRNPGTESLILFWSFPIGGMKH